MFWYKQIWSFLGSLLSYGATRPKLQQLKNSINNTNSTLSCWWVIIFNSTKNKISLKSQSKRQLNYCCCYALWMYSQWRFCFSGNHVWLLDLQAESFRVILFYLLEPFNVLKHPTPGQKLPLWVLLFKDPRYGSAHRAALCVMDTWRKYRKRMAVLEQQGWFCGSKTQILRLLFFALLFMWFMRLLWLDITG